MDVVNGLTRVVILSQAAKEMSTLAFQVRICALDAQVRNAKTRSTALAGFREVSLQMREWSDALTRQLQRLAALCAEAVLEESSFCMTNHKATLLRAAAEGCPRGELTACLASVAERERASAARRHSALKRTLAELHELGQLGMMAVVLSRAAKIEAASAEPQERLILAQVASEFAQHSEAVLRIGKGLAPVAAQAARYP